MRLFGNLMFCCCASQSDDDDGEMLGFSLGFYLLPSTIFPQLTRFAPFLVPIAAFPVALSPSLNVPISPFCSFCCSLSAPRSPCEYLGTSEPRTAEPEQIFTWVVNTSTGFTHIFAQLSISGQKPRVTG